MLIAGNHIRNEPVVIDDDIIDIAVSDDDDVIDNAVINDGVLAAHYQ